MLGLLNTTRLAFVVVLPSISQIAGSKYCAKEVSWKEIGKKYAYSFLLVNLLTFLYLLAFDMKSPSEVYESMFNNDGGIRYALVSSVFYFFGIFVKFTKSKDRKHFFLLSFLVTFLGVLIVYSVFFFDINFGKLTPDQIMFHMTTKISGPASDKFFSQFRSEYVVPAFKDTIFLLVIVYLLLPITITSEFKYSCFTENFHRCVRMSLTSTKLSFLILISSLFFAYYKMDIQKFLNFESDPFIEDHFVDPKSVSLTFPEKKRNMLLIILESMENTFSSIDNGGCYLENLIPELTQISLDPKNVHFSNRHKLGGNWALNTAGYTMGAIFAMLSGLPLKIPVTLDAMGEQGDFMPGAYLLIDILKEQGYNQYELKGSSKYYGANFGLYGKHGSFEIWDHLDMIDVGYLPKGYCAFWGAEDKHLYNFSKIIFDKILKKQKQDHKPFQFIMYTVDTHFPEGYRCSLCQKNHTEQYLDVIRCASRQLNNYLEWLKKQPFFNDTTIYILGDHLTMNWHVNPKVKGNFRTIYNTIINSVIQPKKNLNRVYNTFDWFPTMLAGMGVKIAGDRLALGTNLFSDKKTLSEECGSDNISKSMNNPSNWYNNNILLSNKQINFKLSAQWLSKNQI